MQRRKTPAAWPYCRGKTDQKLGPCATHDPDHDYVEWCDPARSRGRQCDNVTQSSQGSSRKRPGDCPNHKLPKGGDPKKDPSAREGASGSMGGQIPNSGGRIQVR